MTSALQVRRQNHRASMHSYIITCNVIRRLQEGHHKKSSLEHVLLRYIMVCSTNTTFSQEPRCHSDKEHNYNSGRISHVSKNIHRVSLPIVGNSIMRDILWALWIILILIGWLRVHGGYELHRIVTKRLVIVYYVTVFFASSSKTQF